MIRRMWDSDATAVLASYAEGIADGDATFEHEPRDWDRFDATHVGPRLVATDDELVVAWAALTSVSARPAYRGVAEVSIYVASSRRGRGIGKQLLSALVGEAELAGFWTLQAGIFPENKASLRLHEVCGFRVVGVRERIGRDASGRWRDVVLLERRVP